LKLLQKRIRDIENKYKNK